MSYESDGYQEGVTYVCAAGCGGEVTIHVNGMGPLTCCGQAMVEA